MREIVDLFKSVVILAVIVLIFAVLIKVNNKISSPHSDEKYIIPVAANGTISQGELDMSIVTNMDMVFSDKTWDRSMPTSILST